MAENNVPDDETLVSAVQQNFYKEDIVRSVTTPQEAIEIYRKFQKNLSNAGFNLTKWITSDKVADPRSRQIIEIVKVFEAN